MAQVRALWVEHRGQTLNPICHPQPFALGKGTGEELENTLDHFRNLDTESQKEPLGSGKSCYLGRMRISVPSTLTSKTGSGVWAGPLFTSPVVRSNRDPCHGHSTTWPSSFPWASGPPICVQVFRMA